MRISLSPIRTDSLLQVERAGDILTINGQAFDFTSLPDGATIPAGVVPCDWIAGPVDRVGGKIHITIVLPHGANPPDEVAFPSPIIDPPDGEVVLPKEADNVDA